MSRVVTWQSLNDCSIAWNEGKNAVQSLSDTLFSARKSMVALYVTSGASLCVHCSLLALGFESCGKAVCDCSVLCFFFNKSLVAFVLSLASLPVDFKTSVMLAQY